MSIYRYLCTDKRKVFPSDQATFKVVYLAI